MELEQYVTVEVDESRVDNRLMVVRKREVAVGVDIGQAHDPTAIAIVTKVTTRAAEPLLEHLNPEPHARFDVQHLERFKLGTPYPAQVDALEAMLVRPPLNRLSPRVLVDYTGVGRPVFDMFAGRHALRRAQGVVITGGRDTARNGNGYSVPKGELVAKLQALLHAGQLRIAATLPDAPTLLRELQDFRVRFTDAGNATFNAREGAHDDLVLALALAVFGLSWPEHVRELDVLWAR